MSSLHVVMDERSPLNATIQHDPTDPTDLASGQILVHIAKFSLTANTVTYALVGRKQLNTFEHFPVANPRYASTPAWGVGVVTVSKNTGLPIGTRLHGYFPMRKHVVLTPSPVKRKQFEDTAPHRANSIPAYRTYKLSAQPATAEQMQLENLTITDALLFSTGWGCAQQGLESGANTMLLTSASSRTSLTAAFSAKHARMFREIIGVTSARNVEFVKSTGLYDTVVTYDAISSLGHLPGRTVAVYDMAGNRKAKAELRKQLGAAVLDYGLVGQTTVLNNTGSGRIDLHGGASEAGFLVFHALAAAGIKYGKSQMASMLEEAQMAYMAWKLPTFVTQNVYGAEETVNIWDATVNNVALAGTTYMCSLWEREEAEPWTFRSHL